MDVPDYAPPTSDTSALEGAATIYYDSSVVTLRSPSGDALDRYRSSDEFIYDREPRETESIWEKFLRWLRERLRDLLGGSEGEATVTQWIGYTIAALAVIFVIMKLLGTDLRGLFLRGNPNRVSPFAELDENIHEMDFDALIEEAVAARHYRRAVRLLYLKALKILADRGHIDWRRDKTNHDYLRELRGKKAALGGAFADATVLFEYVWYGDMPIDESIFRSVRENMNGFITAAREER